MNSAVSVNTKGVKFVAVLAALATCCLAIMAFSANSAKASTVGAPVDFSFNYVGLTLGTSIAGDIDQLVLTPDTMAGTPPALLGPLTIHGSYTDTTGDFTVPATGFVFPDIGVVLDGATIDGTVGLADPATGNYNSTTGVMSFAPHIKLSLGTTDIAALPSPINTFGSGPLKCQFSPLDLSLSSNGGNWPHDGSPFADAANATNGSISGAYRKLPNVTAIQGDQTVCGLIAAILKPVGGMWLANSSTPVTDMPAPTGTKPDPIVDPPKTCTAPQTGTYPDCKDPVKTLTPAKVSVVSLTKSLKAKPGKSATATLVVKNSGQTTSGAVKACATISSKFAKAPKCASVASLAGGASKTFKLSFKLAKKAKGSKSAAVAVTSSAGNGSGKVKITALKAKKKKHKKH